MHDPHFFSIDTWIEDAKKIFQNRNESEFIYDDVKIHLSPTGGKSYNIRVNNDLLHGCGSADCLVRRLIEYFDEKGVHYEKTSDIMNEFFRYHGCYEE